MILQAAHLKAVEVDNGVLCTNDKNQWEVPDHGILRVDFLEEPNAHRTTAEVRLVFSRRKRGPTGCAYYPRPRKTMAEQIISSWRQRRPPYVHNLSTAGALGRAEIAKLRPVLCCALFGTDLH